MEQVQLKDVMQHQLISINDDGFSIQNAAGRADYDKFGLRTTVIGVPEYFPMALGIDHRIATEVISVGEVTLGEPIKIGIELDTTGAQKAIDEMDERIRSSEAFKLFSGETFINNALIKGIIQSAAIESPAPVANTYNINIHVNSADAESDIAVAIRQEIKKAMMPGGLLHHR